jgi:PPOX class probable F420-dependent enzyme
MELSDAMAFIAERRHGVLVTIRSNGRPQLSNVVFTAGADGTIRISITATRAKYVNLVREQWAAIHVTRDDFYAYTVIEGDVTLSPVAAAPDDATADELVEVYRAISGDEHDDWDEYRRSMVADQRVVVRIRPKRAYGMI